MCWMRFLHSRSPYSWSSFAASIVALVCIDCCGGTAAITDAVWVVFWLPPHARGSYVGDCSRGCWVGFLLPLCAEGACWCACFWDYCCFALTCYAATGTPFDLKADRVRGRPGGRVKSIVESCAVLGCCDA